MRDEIYTAFMKEYIEAPCTIEAIEAIYRKHYPNYNKTPYPNEWYADKDNRLNGCPTGHLRFESRKMVWVKS